MNTDLTTAVLSIVFLATSQAQLSPVPAPPPSLTPPGAPGADTTRMRTLLQLEPRIPVNAETTPGNTNCIYRISQPGSYYLTAGFVGEPGKHGISIDSSDVTIDLNGFTVSGVSNSKSGIVTENFQQRLTVHNGTVSGWGAAGVRFVTGTTSDAINIRAFGNDTGIDARRVTGCTAHDNSSGIICLEARDCLALNNARLGILANPFNYTGGIVMSSVASGNGGIGISAARVIDCETRYNEIGIAGGHVSGCTATNNTADGIQVQHIADSCYSSGNRWGITSNSTGLLVVNNVCTENTDAGIHFNAGRSRIESNNLYRNGAGIVITGVGNTIVKNTSLANDLTTTGVNKNYSIGPLNFVARIVKMVRTPLGTTTTEDSGPSGLVSDILGNSPLNHPWANLSD